MRADEQTETPEDLTRLYEVLGRYSDTAGRTACFTANFVIANPDFEAIGRDRFTTYYEAPISRTEQWERAWLEGIERRVFYP